ncbi:MAG: lipid-A-disaccharide synthase, partial [Pseudomonadota bacterium]
MSAAAYLVAAVEPSADAIGAAFVEAWRRRRPEATFFGCGGAAMQAAGVEALFDV